MSSKPSVVSWLFEDLGYHWYMLSQNKLTVIGLGILMSVLLIGMFAPSLVKYSPYQTNAMITLQPPSMDYPFGTDRYGRDVLSRVFYATRIDFVLAISSVMAAFSIGAVIGALSGYVGGKTDKLVMGIMDVILTFPSFLLAIGLMASLGATLVNLFISQMVIRIPIFARLVHGQMLSVKENEYAEAAICAGNSRLRIIFYHLIPNCIPPALVLITLNFGYAILNIAGLSFLGLGLRPPESEWGLMVAEGAPYITTGEWWLSFFPGMFIVSSVLGFNLTGDGINDLLDPKRRRR